MFPCKESGSGTEIFHVALSSRNGTIGVASAARRRFTREQVNAGRLLAADRRRNTAMKGIKLIRLLVCLRPI